MADLQFSHIGLTCEDPIKIERFYTRHFGFKRTRVYAPGPEQVVMIRSGNIYIEIFKATEKSGLPYPKESGYEFPGWRHICFQIDNLDHHLKKMGDDAKITLGPLDMSEFVPGMRVCWLADPEGNIIELNQGYRDEENPPTADFDQKKFEEMLKNTDKKGKA